MRFLEMQNFSPKLLWKWTILESENADLKKNCEKSENDRKLERDELLEKIEFLKNENLILKSENERLEKTIRDGNFSKTVIYDYRVYSLKICRLEIENICKIAVSSRHIFSDYVR